jgi:hypothetical protein
MSLFQRILFVCRQISTCFGPTGPSSGDSHSCWHNSVSVSFWSRALHETRTIWILNQLLCQQLCESPEDGPVDPKHVEIWRHTNKIRWNSDISWLFISYAIKIHGKKKSLKFALNDDYPDLAMFFSSRCNDNFSPVLSINVVSTTKTSNA